jgi:hypothetical protein
MHGTSPASANMALPAATVMSQTSRMMKSRERQVAMLKDIRDPESLPAGHWGSGAA